MNNIDSNSRRFRGFISYSQSDKAIAVRLHKALENYKVPRTILRTDLERKRRLGLFFRDNEELGASADLGGVLRDAIERSENLIVICSPRSAQSKWVNEEIVYFKSIHGNKRIFAIIIDGQPGSDDPLTECFPPALNYNLGESGQLSENFTPLAVDFREETFRRLCIKLIAGLLDTPFDDLWRRDLKNMRLKIIIGVCISSILVSLIVGLAIKWFNERVNKQEIKVKLTLEQARINLASGHISLALNSLADVYEKQGSGKIENKLRTTLGWLSTQDEKINEIFAPRLIKIDSQNFFLAANRTLIDINNYQIDRRILTKDRKRLVLLGTDESVILDNTNGLILSSIEHPDIVWNYDAVETPDETLLVWGFLNAPRMSHNAEFLLVIPKDGEKSSIFHDLPKGAGAGQFPHLIDRKCEQIGIYWIGNPKLAIGSIDPLGPGNRFRLYKVNSDGIYVSSLPDSDIILSRPARSQEISRKVNQIWNATVVTPYTSQDSQYVPFYPFLHEGPEYRLDEFGILNTLNIHKNRLVQAGCIEPYADSYINPFSASSVRESISVGLFGTESIKTWQETIVERQTKFIPFCNEKNSCLVINEKNSWPFEGMPSYSKRDEQISLRHGSLVRKPPLAPHGVDSGDHTFDIVNGNLIQTYYERHNSGVEFAVCRTATPNNECIRKMIPGANHNRPEVDFLRSPSGRFLLWGFGRSLYDLNWFEDVTPTKTSISKSNWTSDRSFGSAYDFSPQNKELPSSASRASFSADEQSLYFINRQRIMEFSVAVKKGQPWEIKPHESKLPPIPVLQINEKEVIGLYALSNDYFVVLRKDGVIAQVDRESGVEKWRLTLKGLGEIHRGIISMNRNYILVIGKKGARLFNANDGFALSGILNPPPVINGSASIMNCMQDANVLDNGTVTLSCGRYKYIRKLTTFTGDIKMRIKHLLDL